MGRSGQVGFSGFVILWPKPNSTRYKKKICNPTHQALITDPTRRVGLGRVGLASFLHTPTTNSHQKPQLKDPVNSKPNPTSRLSPPLLPPHTPANPPIERSTMVLVGKEE